jgi:hypothetical protein
MRPINVAKSAVLVRTGGIVVRSARFGKSATLNGSDLADARRRS